MARRRRPSRSKLAIRWLGAAILVAIALSYIHPLTSYRHARQEVRDRQASITALERDNAQLTKKLMDTGKSEYVIREARRLGLVREGEHLFIVKGVGSLEERSIP
jgi:cell division protein FtsL